MSPMSQESVGEKSADELLVEILGLYDEIYRCRLALHERISDGHFSISRARYDLSSNSRVAITSADYNMGMKASKKIFDDDNGDVCVREVRPGGTGDAELDEIMQEQAEEERREELLPVLRKRVLARWREERLEKGYTEEEAENPPEEEVEKDVEKALKEKLSLERFNEKVKHDPLYWFGHVNPPKDLVAAKRHFSNSIHQVATIAGLTARLQQAVAAFEKATAR